MRPLLPPATSPELSGDITRVVWGRAIRGFADGFVSVLLAQYLTRLGYSPFQVGAIVTGTLLGSAALTLGFGLRAHRHPLRTILLVSTGIMVATGVGFATVTWFWPLLVIAVLGTLNPSAGDVSVFLPIEQAFVADRVDAPHRPHLFAVYNLGAIFAGAVGALLSGVPETLARHNGWQILTAQRLGFVLYALAAVVIFLVYRRLHRPATPDPDRRSAPRAPLADLATDGARARRAVQSRFRRQRVRGDVVAGAVAAPPVQPLRGRDRHGVRRRRTVRRGFAGARSRVWRGGWD